jgi:hypothetical protein
LLSAIGWPTASAVPASVARSSLSVEWPDPAPERRPPRARIAQRLGCPRALNGRPRRGRVGLAARACVCACVRARRMASGSVGKPQKRKVTVGPALSKPRERFAGVRHSAAPVHCRVPRGRDRNTAGWSSVTPEVHEASKRLPSAGRIPEKCELFGGRDCGLMANRACTLSSC